MAYDKQKAIQAAKEEKQKMKEKIQESIESWAVQPEALAAFFNFPKSFPINIPFGIPF